MIYESSNRSAVDEEFKIILATTNFEEVLVTNIGKLLPLAFGPKDFSDSKEADLTCGEEEDC